MIFLSPIVYVRLMTRGSKAITPKYRRRNSVGSCNPNGEQGRGHYFTWCIFKMGQLFGRFRTGKTANSIIPQSFTWGAYLHSSLIIVTTSFRRRPETCNKRRSCKVSNRTYSIVHADIDHEWGRQMGTYPSSWSFPSPQCWARRQTCPVCWSVCKKICYKGTRKSGLDSIPGRLVGFSLHLLNILIMLTFIQCIKCNCVSLYRSY